MGCTAVRMLRLHGSPAPARVTKPGLTTYLWCIATEKGAPVSIKKRSVLAEFVNVFGNAVAAASAVSHGRQPKARDLRALGIDPAQFRSIRRF